MKLLLLVPLDTLVYTDKSGPLKLGLIHRQHRLQPITWSSILQLQLLMARLIVVKVSPSAALVLY